MSTPNTARTRTSRRSSSRRTREVVSFVRTADGDSVSFVANLSARPVKVSIEGRDALTLAPWEYRFVIGSRANGQAVESDKK